MDGVLCFELVLRVVFVLLYYYYILYYILYIYYYYLILLYYILQGDYHHRVNSHCHHVTHDLKDIFFCGESIEDLLS